MPPLGAGGGGGGGGADMIVKEEKGDQEGLFLRIRSEISSMEASCKLFPLFFKSSKVLHRVSVILS